VGLYADVLDGFDPAAQVRAWGGENRCASTDSQLRSAAPGTVFVSLAGDTYGDLIVRGPTPVRPVILNTVLTSIGAGTVGSTATDALDPAALWITAQEIVAGEPVLFDLGVTGMWVRIGGAPGTDYRVLEQTPDRTQLLLEGAAGAVFAGDAYAGVYKFDTLIAKDGVTVEFRDTPEIGVFDVDGTSGVIVP
jgi:hypothetical protein